VESALVILCHFNLLDNPQGAENSWNLQLISSGVYVERTGKMVESILRLSLCFSKEIRRSALESMELWGLTKEGSWSEILLWERIALLNNMFQR